MKITSKLDAVTKLLPLANSHTYGPYIDRSRVLVSQFAHRWLAKKTPRKQLRGGGGGVPDALASEAGLSSLYRHDYNWNHIILSMCRYVVHSERGTRLSRKAAYERRALRSRPPPSAHRVFVRRRTVQRRNDDAVCCRLAPALSDVNHSSVYNCMKTVATRRTTN